MKSKRKKKSRQTLPLIYVVGLYSLIFLSGFLSIKPSKIKINLSLRFLILVNLMLNTVHDHDSIRVKAKPLSHLFPANFVIVHCRKGAKQERIFHHRSDGASVLFRCSDVNYVRRKIIDFARRLGLGNSSCRISQDATSATKALWTGCGAHSCAVRKKYRKMRASSRWDFSSNFVAAHATEKENFTSLFFCPA